MFTTTSLAIIAATIVATSFISGIFGMAGGLVLLGVLMLIMDVAAGMILFGATQAAANGWRAVLWAKHVRWDIVWRVVLGAAVVFLILRLVALLPNKAVIYIGLGLSPFLADLLPKQLTPDITRPGAPYICGAIIMATTLLAGVAGPVLDTFYQKSGLDRKTVVATKAVTQCTSHLARIAYFGSFVSSLDAGIPWWVFAGAIALAMGGTTLAARVLEKMSDADFRRWSNWLIRSLALVYFARGVYLLATGNAAA
jgi:uncharacterized protein